MKKLFFAGAMLVLFVSYGYGQTGAMQGMSHGQEMTGNQKGQMMEHGQMTSGMMDMMHQMQGMMSDMEGMMKSMSPDKMQRMSKMMMDMSRLMTDMSKMMQKGTASQEEMGKMHDRMMNMQKSLSQTK